MEQGAARPQVSEDGLWWWDGLRWRSTLSADGRQRWDGRQWVPFESVPTEAPSVTATMIAPAAAFATASSATPPRPGLRRRLHARRAQVAVAAAALALLLLVAVAGRTLLGGGPFQPALAATGVKLAWRQGQTLTYRMAVGLDGSTSAGAGGQTVPLRLSIQGDETLRVVSVDASGVATVQASFSGFSGTAGGTRLPASAMPEPVTFQISSDGRIVSGDATGAGAGSLPGADQVSAILPPGEVHPGDAWTVSFDRPNPYGQGVLHFVTHDTFLRYEELGGVRTAVVQSQTTVPLAMTVDFGKLGSLTGSGGAPSGSPPAGAGLQLSGSVDSTATSWVDPASKDLRQTRVTSVFDIKMSLHGLAGVPAALAGGAHMKGTETLSLTAT